MSFQDEFDVLDKCLSRTQRIADIAQAVEDSDSDDSVTQFENHSVINMILDDFIDLPRTPKKFVKRPAAAKKKALSDISNKLMPKGQQKKNVAEQKKKTPVSEVLSLLEPSEPPPPSVVALLSQPVESPPTSPNLSPVSKPCPGSPLALPITESYSPISIQEPPAEDILPVADPPKPPPELSTLDSMDDINWEEVDPDLLIQMEQEHERKSKLADIDKVFQSKYNPVDEQFGGFSMPDMPSNELTMPFPMFTSGRGTDMQGPSKRALEKTAWVFLPSQQRALSSSNSESEDAQSTTSTDATTPPLEDPKYKDMFELSIQSGNESSKGEDDMSIESSTSKGKERVEDAVPSSKGKEKMPSFATALKSFPKQEKYCIDNDKQPRKKVCLPSFTKAYSFTSTQQSDPAINKTEPSPVVEPSNSQGKKRFVDGELKYDKDMLLEFGGFSMGKKKIDISSQAGRDAMANWNKCAEPARSPLLLANPMKQPFKSPKKQAKEDEFKKPTLKNRPFKSPVVNPSLIKAAVSAGRNSAKSKVIHVFDMTVPPNRYKLASLGKPMQYTLSQLRSKKIHMAILNMTAANAKFYVFENHWGIRQAHQSLIKRGALVKHASLEWVENHYSLILWKLASLIRSFPEFLDRWKSQCVLDQLLYRYEREINMGHRPVLKKILEQDDISVKHMILLVADIIPIHRPQKFGMSSKYFLQLTDGWYSVPACIDIRMERAITQKRLKIGQKLSVCGAKLVGNTTAKSPLDIKEYGTMLSISSNSCLPVKWDAKLGYHPKKLVMRQLSGLFADGGMVTAMDIVVYRKFPILYTETTPTGMITRTAKEEDELRRLAIMGLDNQHHVNFCAEQQYNRYTTNNQPERDVKAYFKIRICDAHANSPQSATISLYDANEIQHMDIVEGNRYRVYFVVPYTPKNKKYLGLDFKTTRMTRWETLKVPVSKSYVPRCITLCKSIKDQDTTNDFDLVVYVLDISTATKEVLHGRTLYQQNLLITDQSQSICQLYIRSPIHPLPNYKGQIVSLINTRFDMYDNKFDITRLRATDETEVLTKGKDYVQTGLKALRLWINTHPEEVQAVKDRMSSILH